jgi:translation initiation factor IF-2
MMTEHKLRPRRHNIIYRLSEDIMDLMSEKLPPLEEIEVLGSATVLKLFTVDKKNLVAGSKVESGTIQRSSDVRVMRAGEEIFRGKLKSLRLFKDDVTEIKSGSECGIGIADCTNIKEGDVIEAFKINLKKRRLQ